MIGAGIYFVGGVCYWMWVSGELQPWAEKTSESQQSQSEDGNVNKNVIGNTNECFEMVE